MYSLKTGFQVDIMNPYITTILCAAGFILIIAILILRNEHQRKKYFLRMIRRIYGQVPDREYEAGDLERISHYYQKIKGDGFVIDQSIPAGEVITTGSNVRLTLSDDYGD